MRRWILILMLTLSAGCDSGVVVHDSDRAAALLVDFLTALKSEEGKRQAYAWSDDRFKEAISAAEFERMVASIRSKNRGAAIHLTGYEVFGPVELLNVYARSTALQDRLYFRFILFGSKSRDYYLLQLDVKESGFEKEGRFAAYPDLISVEDL